MTETPERYDTSVAAIEKAMRRVPLPEPTVQQAMARIEALEAQRLDDMAWSGRFERKLENLDARLDAIHAPVESTMLEASDVPETYCRINITKNTKGYSGETTVSFRGYDWEYDEIGILLRAADIEMRTEIARREALDAGDGGL